MSRRTIDRSIKLPSAICAAVDGRYCEMCFEPLNRNAAVVIALDSNARVTTIIFTCLSFTLIENGLARNMTLINPPESRKQFVNLLRIIIDLVIFIPISQETKPKLTLQEKEIFKEYAYC